MCRKLVPAARCALADLIGQFHKGHLDRSGKETIHALYIALQREDEDVSDFQDDVLDVVSDLRPTEPTRKEQLASFIDKLIKT